MLQSKTGCQFFADLVCAKFGKDNSGMGPLDKEETINFLSVVLQTAWIKYKNLFGEQPHGTQKQLLAMLEFCIEEICANFSQQPPKEPCSHDWQYNSDIKGVAQCSKCDEYQLPKERKVSLDEKETPTLLQGIINNLYNRSKKIEYFGCRIIPEEDFEVIGEAIDGFVRQRFSLTAQAQPQVEPPCKTQI